MNALIEFPRTGALLTLMALLPSCAGDDAGLGEREARIAELEQMLAACEAERAAVPTAAAAPAPEAASEPEPPQRAEAEPSAAEANPWVTRETPDDLTGRPVRTLSARSVNEFELSFPYQGPQRARLTLREHPRFGNDVLLAIERGQFICNYPDCRVEVVFDGGDPIRWRANRSDSGASDIIFLAQEDRFRREAMRSHEIRIAATLHNRGQLTFVFPGLADAPEGNEAPQ